MKKLVLALLTVVIMTIVTIVYEKVFIQSEFGPTSMLAILVLCLIVLSLTITFLSINTRYQEIITRTWMLLISTGLTFIVFDLIAGWILIKPLSPELSPDKVRHHMLVPNTHSRFEQPDFSYIQRVNNLGIRGEDRSLEKPEGHYRILTLGDSFTMGKGVEDNQTFSALLEQSLNQNKSCKDRTIEVLNGGVDSYAPILSYLQLSTDLVKTSPDLVVLNLDISDLTQEMAYRKQATRDDSGRITGVPGGKNKQKLLNERIRIWIDQHLFFTRLILFYVNKIVGYQNLSVENVVTHANSEIVNYTLASDTVDRAAQWEQIFESISMIKQFTDQNSMSFVLVIYPWAHQISDKEWVPGRYTFMDKDAVASDKYLDTVKLLAEKNGIPLINLFETFREYKSDSPLFFKYDMHWTTEGHKVMAGALEQYLTKNYSTKWCQ